VVGNGDAVGDGGPVGGLNEPVGGVVLVGGLVEVEPGAR